MKRQTNKQKNKKKKKKKKKKLLYSAIPRKDLQSRGAVHYQHQNPLDNQITFLCNHYVSCRLHLVKDRFLTLAHLFGTVCLKHSSILILPPLSRPPSRRTCSVTISKLSFSQPNLSPRPTCVCSFFPDRIDYMARNNH